MKYEFCHKIPWYINIIELLLLRCSLMICAYNRVHYGPTDIFLCLHIILPHYHLIIIIMQTGLKVLISKMRVRHILSSVPGRSSKLTHTHVLKLTPVHSRRVVSCPVQPRACHWDYIFRHNFSGMKRTCWTTASWRSCLSLEVVSSIPAGSTIIYRFLCGFLCVSLCPSLKIKPTDMYMYM